MKKCLFTATAAACILGLWSCGKKNSVEEAYKLVEEQGDKIEVATVLVSDTIIVDSLDNVEMEHLEACLEYLKGMHDELEPETRQKLDYVIEDKIKNNLDTKSTTVGGELIDNPNSEIAPYDSDEE